jgi:DNA-binding transcriptional MerR regulator
MFVIGFGSMDQAGDGSGHDAPDEWLTTGEMARLGQTTLRTVRFYEAEGLITSCEREDGCHRKFARSELKKLQIITDLRDAGLSLGEIKGLIALKGKCTTPAQAACNMITKLCAQVEEVERRIGTLARVRTELRSMLSMLNVCRECKNPAFPTRCDECEVVKQPGAERATRLLWKH